jgi:transposase
MEALIITLCQAMPVARVQDLFNIRGNDRIWGILDHYIPKARGEEDFSSVQNLGVDETAARRGHDYITLFHDLDQHKVLFATEGRKAEVFERFADDLEEHNGCGENIKNVCMDMSKSFQAGAANTLPWAEISFDEFHVIQMVNEVVNEVRRVEVKTEPDLIGSRWGYLKDASNWTEKQINQMYTLSRMRLKTTKAWQLKESLREIFQTAHGRQEAEVLLNKWYSWARRCRVPQMKKFAETIKRHWSGILNSFDSGLTNGSVEGINSIIQAAKARARGYSTKHNLILMAYLIAGKLAHLPRSPFRPATISCGQGVAA